MDEPIYFGVDEGREPDYSCIAAMRKSKIGDLDAIQIVDVLFLDPRGLPFDVDNERVS